MPYSIEGIDQRVRDLTQKAVEAYREELKKGWDELFWEPKFDWIFGSRYQNGTYKGVPLREFGIYIDEAGNLKYLNTKSQLNPEGYTRYVATAASAMIKAYMAQLDEVVSDPEGRNIIWRPGQRRFGYIYRGLYADSPTVTVRARTETTGVQLFCSQHPDSLLIPKWDRESGATWIPTINCAHDPEHFSILASEVPTAPNS